jgi:hypothetical protein
MTDPGGHLGDAAFERAKRILQQDDRSSPGVYSAVVNGS